MKILHDLTTVSSLTVTSEASGYSKENAVDLSNFKQWRSTSKVQQTIVLNFTGSINSIAIFGANFSDITIDGTPQTLIKDTLMGDYRGCFTVDTTSSITLIVTVQTVDELYYTLSAIAIGNDNDLNNVVYPFNSRLVNPVHRVRLESENENKKAKGQNYRLIELRRKALDFDGIGDLSEIKQLIGKGDNFVLYTETPGECFLGTRTDSFSYTESFGELGSDSLILEETGGKSYNTRQLIEITLDSSTLYYATETLKFPLSSPVQYIGKIISSGTTRDILADDYSQHAPIPSIKISLDDRDGTIEAVDRQEDLRGKTVTRKTVDMDTDTVISVRVFTVRDVSFSQTTATFDLQSQNLELWHIKHPKLTFKAKLPNVVLPPDSNALGKTIPFYYGPCFNVPCFYVQSETGEYLYVVSKGELESIVNVYRDNVLVDPSEYTTYVSDGLHYLDFPKEQLDFTTRLHNITADVLGLKVDGGSYSANNILCFQHWLENEVGVTVNASSFATAETVSDDLLLAMGGGIIGDLEAIDWRNHFLLACRGARLWLGDNGYEVEIPEYKSSDDAVFTSDNIIEIISNKKASVSNFVNNVTTKFRQDYTTLEFLLENDKTCGKAFGTDKEYKLLLINDWDVASTITQWLRNTFLFGDRTIVYKTGRDAEGLKEGSIVKVSYPKPYFDEARFMISEISKTREEATITATEYSESIYDRVHDPISGGLPTGGARSGDDVTSLIARDGAGIQTYFYLPSSAGGSAKTKLQVYNDSGTLKVV